MELSRLEICLIWGFIWTKGKGGYGMVYVFLASGFEEIEALSVVDILRRADVDVQTVGVGNRQITGSHGIPVLADADTSSFLPGLAEGVVLPGGMPGATNLESDSAVIEGVRHCAAKGGLVAAICAAPFILGHMGLLEGRKATCYPGFESELIGAQIEKGPVCVDENTITGNGPGAAVAFALALVRILKGAKTADTIKRGMQCV